MNDLVRITEQQYLPDNPTAADTADWYRLGDAVEKHGRHMKRQAVAAEYQQRPRGMAAWCREVQIPEGTMRELLTECRSVGLLESSDMSEGLSQALPTARAAREYAKAPESVKGIVLEMVKDSKDEQIEIKAAEIKKLTEQITLLEQRNQQLETAKPEYIEAAPIDLAAARAFQKGQAFDVTVAHFMGDLSDYFSSIKFYLDQELVDLHMIRLRELEQLLSRYLNPVQTVTPTTIDI